MLMLSSHLMLEDARKAFDAADRGPLMRMMALYCGVVLPCRDSNNADRAEVQAQTETVDFLVWIQILIGDEPLGFPHKRRAEANGSLSRTLDLFSGVPQGSSGG